MSTDQTPALSRATEALVRYETSGMCRPGKKCQMCDCGVQNMDREELAEDLRRNLDRTRFAVSAALHDPDDALVRVVKRALILADNDGDTRGMSQAMSDAYERGARDALDALRAAILGPCPECHGEDGRHKMRCSQTGGGQAHITTTREDS